MIVLLSGTINTGKTTCAKRLSFLLPHTVVVEVDQFFRCFPGEDFAAVSAECLKAAVNTVKYFAQQEYNVIVPHPLWEEDLRTVMEGLDGLETDIHYITLIVSSQDRFEKRSKREDREWETQIVQWHRQLGVTKPMIGVVLDNAYQTISQTVWSILSIIRSNKARIHSVAVSQGDKVRA